MTTMRVVGECFFWYRLTRVFPDKFHRAVKRLCVCVCLLKVVGKTLSGYCHYSFYLVNQFSLFFGPVVFALNFYVIVLCSR